MNKINFTKSQNKAINSTTSKILVSASAGTGKTFVMVNRIAKLIAEDHQDLDNFLVLTFAKASANEMKERISKHLYSLIDDNFHVKNQLKKLSQAKISTLHSFSADLIRQYFYIVDVAPKFSIIDEKKSKLLQRKVLTSLLDDLYEAGDTNFLELERILCEARSNEAFIKIILELYTFSRALASPTSFLLNECVENYDNPTIFEDIIFNDGISTITSYKEKFVQILKLLTTPILGGDLSFVTNLIYTCDDLLKAQNVSYLREFLENVEFATTPRANKNFSDEDKAQHAKLLKANESFKKEIRQLSSTLNLSLNNDTQSLAKSRLQLLCQIVIDFSISYEKEKKKFDFLDYSDLEHFALKVLQNDAVREEVSSKYTHVFIDEYQDTSKVQEALISKIAKHNLFMVGDIKQSIYSFRQCDREIFSSKEKDFAENSTGELVYLNDNFRSDGKILSFVNHLFAKIMTASVGDDYKNNSMFNIYNNDGHVELHYINFHSEKEEATPRIYSVKKDNFKDDSFLLAEMEGEVIAKRILSLVGNTNELGKTISFKDITILLRSHNSEHASLIEKALIDHNIPTNSFGASLKISDFPEVLACINFLSVLQNYKQDIPLLSVLKSGFGGFSDLELFHIKKEFKGAFFYESFENALTSPVLGEKISQFFKNIEKFSTIALGEGGVSALEYALTTTPFSQDIAKQPYGREKLCRIEEFLNLIRPLDENNNLILLNQNIEKLQDDLNLNGFSDAENCVKLMSIHKSKGLEFDVVFLSGTGRSFNFNSLSREKVLKSSNLGLSISHYDVVKKLKVKTISDIAMKIHLKNQLVEEELRLLYVALTRAKHSLIITGAVKSKSAVESISDIDIDEISNSSTLLNSKCFLDMILGGLKNNEFSSLKTYCYNTTNAKKSPLAQTSFKTLAPWEKSALAVSENLNFSYPHQKSTTLLTKFSASSLKRTPNIEEEVAYKVLDLKNINSTSTKLSQNANKVGSAYHLLIENCQTKLTLSQIENKLFELTQNKLIDEDISKTIDCTKVFTALNHKILQGGQHFKEKSFMLYIPASDILDTDISDKVLVQGVIDLLILNEDNTATVVDFKMTREKNVDVLKNRYKTQLDIYKKAVTTILKIPVKAVLLVNIDNGTLIDMQ